MRKTRLLIALSVVLLFVCMLALWLSRLIASAPRGVRATYTKLDLTLIGEEKHGKPVSYGCLAAWSSASPRNFATPAVAHDLALVFDHASYPVDTVTSAVLQAHGFSEQRISPDEYNMNIYPWPLYGLFRFRHGRLYEFSFGDQSTTSSLGFAYRGGPEKKLPLSQQQMEAIFGKPDKISRSIDWEYVFGKVLNPPARLLFRMKRTP